jgi:phosphoenolpyruvate-protein phosphotransferase
MTLEYRFVCLLPNGLHARPASELEAVCSRFPSEIVLVNERTGVGANAKSVLGLISADIHSGDPLLLQVSGSEREAAFADLTQFLREDFIACDEALPPAPTIEAFPLPRSLRAASPPRILRGAILCRGLAQGVIKRVDALQIAVKLREELAGQTVLSPGDERARVNHAIAAVHRDLEKEADSSSGLRQDILRAHAALLKDVAFAENVRLSLAEDSTATAADAIIAAVGHFTATLRQSTSAYLQERVLDLQDVGARLLREIYGPDAIAPGPTLDRASIVIGDSLTPGQFLALDRRHLGGLVLQHAGSTSHAIILARSFGLPTLVGVDGVMGLIDGSDAVLDANLGLLLPEPNEPTRRYYAMERRRIERVAVQTQAFVSRRGASRDGRFLPVLANVSSAEEVGVAMEKGAEGIGLFRTEMLFMDRATPPSEDEQAAIYTAAARAARGQPVTLRTFDIGGDKPISYLNLPTEMNPFLGYRGARLYKEFRGLLKTQLRAIFRAAAHGSLKIMAPMISCPEEMREFRAAVEEVRMDFPSADVPIGMMIEVPAVGFALADFAPEADFFSLGTNDLLQYFLAMDRDNARVASLSSAFHPSFLRFLRHIVTDAHRYGKPVGICGELAENPEALPLLVGLELDSLSMGAPRIPSTKAHLATLDFSTSRVQLEEVLTSADRDQVQAHLRSVQTPSKPQPLLSIDLIETDSASSTKHEAIRELANLLSTAGRVHDPVTVEEAIWMREDSYSTGFGYGFAVPHCQSSDMQASSIGFLRLRQPIEWNSTDGKPVQTVIFLALRAEDKGREHLRIFSKLSRSVMRESFRKSLEQAPSPEDVLAILQIELDLQPAVAGE